MFSAKNNSNKRNNKNLFEMKTRFLFAALLLLAFGSMKAQDTITVVKSTSMPDSFLMLVVP